MSTDVVFVDDEIDLCEAYEALFNSMGISTKAFSDTDEASQFISENSIKICFIDYRMPKCSGDEFRAQVPQSVPCFLLTGELSAPDFDGFIKVVKKPIDVAEIQKIITEYSD